MKRIMFAAFAALVLFTFLLAVSIPTIVAATANIARAATDEVEARGALEQAFQRLRDGDYDALYNVLPSTSQRRVTRERFIGALRRSRDVYDLDRMEIGAVRVVGDLAVADMVVYGRLRQPMDGEGKIVARQYMIREGRQWRVTTGERATVRPLLAANPKFARRFPPAAPRIFLKRDGRWVDVSSLAADMRRTVR